jgi:DNA-binding SARP family transcriptional activator/predicted ATPase
MTASFELSLLGTVAITLNGEQVSGQLPAKSQALLCYLAVTGQPYSREKLAGLLWGDKPETRAKANLRKSLSSLRKLSEDALIITRQTVAFNHDGDYWLDVEIFESALAEDDPAPQELQPLRDAAELYRGEFLAGFSVRQAVAFEEWVLAERERLRQLAIQALHRLSEALSAQGEYDAAIEYTNRLLALEPWQEEAHRQLMTLLAHSGQQSAALAQYETCRHILAEELGVEPLPETQDLYHRLKTRRGTSPHNLPPQTTPFVGRQAELAQIAQQLGRADCRLLTLIGTGGIGKTRLALQAARQALDTFADGVYFVPLAGISSPEFMVPTIGEALGYPLSGKADPKRQLLNYLHQKEMLLVLDNFEHLLSSPEANGSERDLVLEMVNTTPRLKLLVTSRERLNLQAEWLLPLQGLPYPLPQTTLGEGTFGAVELFVQGAQRVRSDFSLSAEWPEVVRICQLLEGMPLGIELAATWVSMMPCAEIVQELARGLDLLSTTLHDVPARHRSMEAVFDRSWHLLSGPERAIFKKLSVFRGGFGRQAAQEVAGASLSTLAVLVDKSLLRVVSPGRYDMLEPLKQYAAGKLAETPAEDQEVQHRHGDDHASIPSQVRQRHARYYLSLAEQAEQALRGPEQLAWLGRMESECDNLRTALGWMLAGQEESATLGLKLAGTLGLFWQMRSHHWSEGYRWLKAALENADRQHPADRGHPGDSPSAAMRAKALLAAGTLLHHQWRFAQAAPLFHESLTLYQELDDQGGIADALYWLGCHAFRQKDYREATRLLEQSLAVYRQGNNQYGISMALRNLGDCARLLNDYERSNRLYEQGLALARKTGNKRSASSVLNSLGELARLRGNLEEAKAFGEEGLSIDRELGNEFSQAITLHNLGHTTLRLGDHWGANAIFKESLCLFQKLEYTRGITLCLAGLAGVASAMGEAERATKLLSITKTVLEASNVPLPLGPADQAAYDRYLAATEAQLDPQAFAAAWEAGGRMTLSQAIACALELSPEAPPNS